MGGMLGGANIPEQNEKMPDYSMVEIEKLNLQNSKLAENIRPEHMGIIVGAFPYKKQLEEFQRALHYDSLAALYSDPKSVPSFSGFEVERREVLPDGQTMQWYKLDLEKFYKPLMLLTGLRFEAEDPELKPIVFDGLAMPRLLQFRDGQYPKIETELKGIEDTLASVKEAREGQKIPPPNPFKDDKGLSLFGSVNTQEANTGNNGGSNGPGPGPGMPPMRPGSGGPGDAGPGATQGQNNFFVPEYCLLRIIDVTVQPGHTYEYRFKLKMANPNYERKDVVFPNLARDKEIVTADWIPVTERMTVPQELFFYAVDVKKMEPKEKARMTPLKPKQVALQAHRWVDVVPDPSDPKRGYPVGDWLVAERITVYPGEYVTQNPGPEVEVPIWLYPMERFTIASKGRKDTIPVYFGDRNAPTDPVLIDSEWGDKMVYSKLTALDDKERKTATITDTAPQEVLMMSPEGRLVRHDSEADRHDKERETRYKAWKDRIREVREQKPNKTGTAPASPFGGNDRPGGS